MIKQLLISTLLCTVMYAESFDEFLQEAIVKSPYLKSSALAVKQSKEDGQTLTRYANPTLEVEYSEFQPDIGDDDNGYRVNISQPVRLWSIGDDKKALADTMIKAASASYIEQRAMFIKNISFQFTLYSQQNMLLKLGNEELEIAKKIYEVSKARYESGTISRGLMLQSQVDYEMIQIKNESLSLRASQSYYNILRLAGINQEIDLSTNYVFNIKQNLHVENPSLNVLSTQQEQSLSEAKVNSNKIEWMNIFAEFENEPEQDIIRAGVNFPLAVFNTKSQERQIAKIQASRSRLLLDNETARLDIETIRLQKQRTSLEKQKVQNKQVLNTEIELLEMFQEGYKIANINLLQLQDIKNKVITTKRSLIQIKTALDQNAITTNFNQGSYNE